MTDYNWLQPLLSTLGLGYHYHSTVFLEQGKVLEYKYYNMMSTVIYLVVTVPHHHHITAVYCITSPGNGRSMLPSVVALPLFLLLVSWWDAASIASVADTIELAFLHQHGWDGTWHGIDGGVVAIIAGCMQGSMPTTSLKLYTTTNHPRDLTSRDPNHDDSSNKWHQRSLSNNYNTSSSSNTTTSSQLRPPHTLEWVNTSGQGDNNNSKTWQGDNNNRQQDEVGGNNDESTQESTTFNSATQQLRR
ncbi:hypothetical protein EDB89DRAFT_1909485 [Lactarius sanguifluus]|nr:hypothetical protein EDB89DRAFT_1909485 [Lactarius sanguifluus]